jgi:hypothetical protein
MNILFDLSQFDFAVANFVTRNTFRSLEKEALKKSADYFEDEKIIGLKILNNLRNKINGFVHLSSNWDSYNAVPISAIAINFAIETVNYLNAESILFNGLSVSVFPMRDGGVQFEFDGEHICVELEINPSGDLTFILFDEEDNIINKVQIFELEELSTLLEEAQYA